MKYFVFGLALAGAILGFIASCYWLRASKVPVVPLFSKLGQMEPLGGSNSHWMIGLHKAYDASSKLNSIAVKQTSASVLISELSAILSAWP